MLSLASDKFVLLQMAEDYDRQAMAAEERLREQEDQALLDSRLRLHRAAVVVLMRDAGERRMAIKESKTLIERSLEALHLAEVLLSRTPFVSKGAKSPSTSSTFTV